MSFLNYYIEYSKIKEYIDNDKIKEGLNYITKMQNSLGSKSSHNKLVLDVLTCVIQDRADLIDENLILISKLENTKIEKSLMCFDFTIAKADTFWKAGKHKEALLSLETIEDDISKYKENLSNPEEINDIIERDVYIQHVKGVIYWYLGEVPKSQACFELAFSFVDKLSNKFYLANALNDLGNIYSYQGELDLALDKHQHALELRKNLANKTDLACSLANIGEINQYMGKYDQALNFYKQAQVFFESLESYLYLPQLYHDLININLLENNFQEAQVNLEKLKILNIEHNDNLFIQTYLKLSEALILKSSSSLITKFKAADNLFQIANAPGVDKSLTAEAIFNLADLLLLEIKLLQDEEKLKDVYNWVEKLLLLAEQLNSPVLIWQTYILDSKLKLLEFKIEDSKNILLKARDLAKHRGIKKYENLVNRELEQLKSQEGQWEILRLKGATLGERMDLTGLEKTLDNLIRKRQDRSVLMDIMLKNIETSVQDLNLSEMADDQITDYFYKMLSKETYITIYRQFKLGPEIYLSDELDFSKTDKKLLEIKLGVFFITAVGQGENSNEGLYGPLPFPDNSDYISIIYSCFMKDLENKDPRYKGNSYCLFIVTFPKQFESYYSNRSFLTQIFRNFQEKFEKIQDIQQEDIAKLKSLLIR